MSQTQEIRAILHCRVSTARQKSEGYSLDHQLRVEREFAKSLNATIVKEIVSNFANEGDDREDLDEIFHLLQIGEANTVIFFDIDRTTRGGIGEWFLLTKEIQDLGGTIYYANRRVKAGESEESEAMDGFYAILANMEKRKIRTRTMYGFRSKVIRGEYPGHGKTNYGYKRVDKNIIPHEEYSLIIQEIFDRFTGWNNYNKQGVRDIKRELELRLISSPTGKTEWNIKTIYKILHNPIYKGSMQVFTWKSQGYIKSKNKKRYIKVNRRPSNEQITVSVPPIISELQWELAQQILGTGLENSPRNSRYDYLLAKRIRCGKCNCIMRGKRVQRKTKEHFYYRCHGQDVAFAHKCDMPTITMQTLDNSIWNWIESRLLDRHIKARAIDTALPKVNDSQVTALKQRLTKLEDEDNNLKRQARKGIINDEEFAEGRQEIKRERDSLQETIARLENKRANELLLEHHKEQVEYMLEQYKTAFHELPFNLRRQLIELLDIRVTVWDSGDIQIRSIFGIELIK